MRTKIAQDSLKKISSINRQLTHAFFIGEQFLIDNAETLTNEPEGLTSVIFSKNPYKDKFNCQLKQFKGVYTEYQDFLLISSFVFLYSICEQYQDDLFVLAQRITRSTYLKLDKKTIAESLIVGLGSSLGQIEIDTLDYIRLRRNCLVHAEGIPNALLLNLIAQKGNVLNQFWQQRLNISTLNFSSNAVETLSENELIEIIRIIRYLISTIDGKVISLIGKTAVVEFLLNEFRIIFVGKIHSRERKRLETMFFHFIQREFGLGTTDLDISNIVF